MNGQYGSKDFEDIELLQDFQKKSENEQVNAQIYFMGYKAEEILILFNIKNCTYGILKEEIIRDRLVFGVKKFSFLKKAVESELTLEKAIQIVLKDQKVLKHTKGNDK
ncbi:hypothetical protein LAZ67_X002148 [Cordylochernes scorpioides]|uniref:Uncharacterized protein n=1 Tax=Cordylochernes scorpioides TaxID=51811 RepID=A0ABY6LT55_9ARAC|nr:hypothetical protein LAZ67_X002148 [Cordylochernes scorpioides]